MKIEIDTLRDSKEDIRKVIKMLMHLLEDHDAFNSIIESGKKKDPYSAEENNLNLDFLDSPQNEDKKEEPEEEPKVDFSTIIEY